MHLVAQVWTAVLLVVAVIGAGAALSGLVSRWLRLPIALRISMVGASGLAFVGVVTLVLGHLHLLGPWLPYGLASMGLVLGILGRSEIVDVFRLGWRGIRRQFRAHPIPLTAVSAALVVAAVATIVPPSRQDEVDYHWPAPLAWAQNGGWDESPFRHVNGFPFMEIIYTAAATQGSYTAAHLMHFAAFLALGFAVAGVAAVMGVRGTGVTAAAALAMPVVWDWSYVAYNDTPVATYSVLAVGVVLAAPRRSLGAAALAGGLLAVGVSIKPTGVVAVGVVGLALLMRYFFKDHSLVPGERGPSGAVRFRTVVEQCLILVAPVVVALGFWTVRQYLITGHWIDPALSAAPSEDALSRLPSTLQQILAPLLPFVSGIIGAQEPWGGRTALVLQVLLIPAIIYVIWRRGAVLKRFALILVPAWAHWIVLGFVNVRTRFHIVTWTLMIVAMRIATEDFVRRYPRARLWVELVWTVAILLALVDVSFEMYRTLRILWTPDSG